jgi:hypothetical protein
VVTEWIIAGAAVLQAASAILIYVLTRGLVGATKAYVDQTGALVEEARQANALERRAADESARARLAFIEVRPDGRELDTAAQEWRFLYDVENVGVGRAHALVLGFEGYEFVIERSLSPGDIEHVRLSVEAADTSTNPAHPRMQSIIFRDPVGAWWVQPVTPTFQSRTVEPLGEP